ncbi:type A chloramphenicol O-acetyltransferase [Sporanaerobium hydrogeniformans]|uniref:Type A chloramphenicol O-acetyltransferase n=1 Tax=Sporanaerobium hydrogeniformans TaxID=3072179 RepID=A0AC61DDD1_9FIRM|nr:type A chloramphenicol O-acetyltransferase [Sporanaerobium hydrogeniformans]PHV70783.1 type A chloramphenicol O-acetyltransferase [Sporanaerobium hydrogeniformans]
MFQLIDRSTWKREEYFNHYLSDVPCTYSMTVRLDITELREKRVSLYPTMLYLIACVVNRHEEFRTALDDNGEVGVYDYLSPCYTVFHKESETFSNLWTTYSPNYKQFCANYENDIQEYGSINRMIAKPNAPKNTFSVSMIPWSSFEGFNLNLQKGYSYLLPIFTMGKFETVNDRCLLPLAVQVHHAVCDGFHLSRFFNELQEMIEQLPTN